jgi:hypothetical protein
MLSVPPWLILPLQFCAFLASFAVKLYFRFMLNHRSCIHRHLPLHLGYMKKIIIDFFLCALKPLRALRLCVKLINSLCSSVSLYALRASVVNPSFAILRLFGVLCG